MSFPSCRLNAAHAGWAEEGGWRAARPLRTPLLPLYPPPLPPPPGPAARAGRGERRNKAARHGPARLGSARLGPAALLGWSGKLRRGCPRGAPGSAPTPCWSPGSFHCLPGRERVEGGSIAPNVCPGFPALGLRESEGKGEVRPVGFSISPQIAACGLGAQPGAGSAGNRVSDVPFGRHAAWQPCPCPAQPLGADPPLCLSTPPGGSVACPRSVPSAGETELFPSFLPFFSLSTKGCWCPPGGSPVQVGVEQPLVGHSTRNHPAVTLGPPAQAASCSAAFPFSHLTP